MATSLGVHAVLKYNSNYVISPICLYTNRYANSTLTFRQRPSMLLYCWLLPCEYWPFNVGICPLCGNKQSKPFSNRMGYWKLSSKLIYVNQGIPKFSSVNEVLRTGKIGDKYFMVKVFRIYLLISGETAFNLPSPHEPLI